MAAKLTVVTAFKTEGAAESERAAKALSREYGRLSAQLDPAIANQQRMERAQKTLDRALEKGKITQAEYNRQLALAKTRFGDAAGGSGVFRRSIEDMTASFGRMAAAAAVALGALAVVTLGKSLRAWEEEAKAVRQLEAALASTGSAAGRTVAQLQAQASTLQRTTETADDAILVAQGQMLTFTKVTGQVFDQAIESVLDLSVRMDQDLRTSVIAVGKALNDPVRGLGSLARAGIQFTDQQKEMVKALVESGDLVGAQTIILKELETQFGGSAKAARDAGSGMIPLQNAASDLLELIGGGLAPAVRGLTGDLEEMATDPATIAFFRNLGQSAGDLIGVLKTLTGQLGTMTIGWLHLRATALGTLALIREHAADAAKAVNQAPGWMKTLALGPKGRDLFEAATEQAGKKAAETAKAAQQAALDLAEALTGLNFRSREAAEGLGTTNTGMQETETTADGLQERVKALTTAISEHEKAIRAAEQAIQEAQKRYREYSGAIDDVAKALGDLDAIQLAEWIEENLAIPPATVEEWQNLADIVERIEETLDELGMHTKPIASPELAAAGVIFDVSGSAEVLEAMRAMAEAESERRAITAEVSRLLADGTVSLQEAAEIARQMGVELDHWSTDMVNAFDALGVAVGAFDEDLGKAISKMADLVVLYQQAGTAAGNWQAAAMTANNIATAENPDYSAIGAAIGAVIGGAIAGYFTGGLAWYEGALIGASIGSWLGGMIKKGLPEFYGAIEAELGSAVIGPSSLGGGFAKIGKIFGKQIKKAIDDILFLVGAELESIAEGIDIKIKKGTSVFVDGQEFSFKEDTEAAISFAITEALKRATITGASPEVIAALANTIATDLDSLFKDLEVAVKIRDINLDEVQRSFRTIAQEFDFLRKKAIELGMGIEALNKIDIAEIAAFGDQRNQILGIQEDPAARIRRQAAMFNAELALRELELASKKAALEAEAAILRARIQVGETGYDVDKARLQAQLALFGVEVELVNTIVQTAASAAEALAAITQQVASLDAILAGLAGLEISDADINKAIGNLGGGGGTKRSDMEALRDLLDQMAFDRLLAGMTELEAGLARLAREYDQNLEKAHGNAELIARLTEEYRLQAEQLLLNIQLSAVDTFRGFLGIGGDSFSQLEQQWQNARKAVEEAGFGAERTAQMLARLNRGYEEQLDLLSRQTFVGIGDGLMGLLERYYGGVEGFERFRMNLERIRFELEYANLRLQFEILKAAGTLGERVLRRMQRVFDFIDENPIDWSKFVTPDIPNIPAVNDRFRETNDLLAEMARRLVSAKEGITSFLLSLQTGELGGRSSAEMFQAAYDQFQKIVTQGRAGNIQALEQFPEIARRLAEITRERFGSGASFQDILALIENAGIELLNVPRVIQDNVVFDPAFLAGQRDQIDLQRVGVDVNRSGFAQLSAISNAGFSALAQESSQQTRTLRAMADRLARVEAEQRLTREYLERKAG
jgi:hypothetical protein